MMDYQILTMDETGRVAICKDGEVVLGYHKNEEDASKYLAKYYEEIEWKEKCKGNPPLTLACEIQRDIGGKIWDRHEKVRLYGNDDFKGYIDFSTDDYKSIIVTNQTQKSVTDDYIRKMGEAILGDRFSKVITWEK